MVIACEKCNTRFQLDESRLPSSGVRVRCSRCKHTFFAQPEGGSREEAVHAAVAEALESEGPEGRSIPQPTRDLEPARDPGETALGDTEFAPRDGAQIDDNNDWEFIDPPEREAGQERSPETQGVPERQASPAARSSEDALERFPLPSAARSSVESAATAEAQPEPEVSQESAVPLRSSFDEIGSPDDWNLIPDEAPKAVEAPSVAPRSAEVAAPSEAQPARERLVRSLKSSPRVPVGGVPTVLAWLAAGILISAGLVGALASGSGGPERGLGSATVAGLSVERVRGRFVENAPSGPIYVVSGTLRNPGARAIETGAVLEVRLAGREGAGIPGARAEVGAALEERDLREGDPTLLKRELRRTAEQLARRPFGPGERIEFHALFEQVPPEARRFVLETGTPAAATTLEEPGAPIEDASSPEGAGSGLASSGRAP